MSDMSRYVRLAAAMRELAELYTHGQRTGESDRQVILFNAAARACDTLVATLTCLRAEEAVHAQTTRERDEALALLREIADECDCPLCDLGHGTHDVGCRLDAFLGLRAWPAALPRLPPACPARAVDSYRHEYDHACGYDGENQLYVEPVCSRCHHIREEDRRGLAA